MGKFALIRTKSIVEYDNTPLYCHCDSVASYLDNHGLLSSYISEDACESLPNWEISKSGLKDLVEELESKKQDEIVFDEYTAGMLVEMFKSLIELSSDDANYSDSGFIYIDWF